MVVLSCCPLPYGYCLEASMTDLAVGVGLLAAPPCGYCLEASMTGGIAAFHEGLNMDGYG